MPFLMSKYPRLTPKQTVVFLAFTLVLWIPMAIFALRFVDRFSPRVMALGGAINLLLMTWILTWSYKGWISRL